MDLSILNNNGNIHDTNTLKYVLIHEISHILCTEWGHTDLFLEINNRLLYYMI